MEDHDPTGELWTSDKQVLEGAIAFAKTIRKKSLAEQLGLLILTFDMDVVSAKALILLTDESPPSQDPP